MTQYLFIFGRTPEMAEAEFSVFYPDYRLLMPDVALAGNLEDSPETVINRLGGTFKIAKIVSRSSVVTADNLADIISLLCNNNPVFGLSYISKQGVQVTGLLSEIKSRLSDKGIRSSYVTNEHGNQLSGVVVTKKKVIELIICSDSNGYVIAHTVAVQPFEDWNKRDYGRPYADAKHGMLPPKVARMAVNITLGNNPNGKIVCDPFCGMGTILAEAALCGAIPTGCDIDGKVTEKASRNLAWLSATYSEIKQTDIKLHVCDAVHLSSKYGISSIDAIITEPYMGTPNIGEGTIDLSKAKNIIKGLGKLYLGCLREWHKLLKPNGKVCIAFPSIAINGLIISVKKPIDTCENLGYTKVLGPIAYARQHAVLTRNFYLFEKRND